MVSNWNVTSCSFLCCVFIFHLLRVTHCCCNPSIPGSLSMAAWLPVPPCSCHPVPLGLMLLPCTSCTPTPGILLLLSSSWFLQHHCHLHPCLLFIQPQSHLLLCVFPYWIHDHCHCLFVSWHHWRKLLLTSLSGPDCFHLELAMHSQVSTGLLCNLDLLLDRLSE